MLTIYVYILFIKRYFLCFTVFILNLKIINCSLFLSSTQRLVRQAATSIISKPVTVSTPAASYITCWNIPTLTLLLSTVVFSSVLLSLICHTFSRLRQDRISKVANILRSAFHRSKPDRYITLQMKLVQNAFLFSQIHCLTPTNFFC